MKELTFMFMLLFPVSFFAQVKVKMETVFAFNDEKTTLKEYMFKQVAGIINDADGNFYVYQNFGTEIRKFSKDGKYIKTIGRHGSGPGDIKYISELYINSEKELVLHDQMNFRITYYTLDGVYKRSIPMSYEMQSPRRIKALDDSSLLSVVSVSGENLSHGNLFRIYDKELKNVLTSFGHSTLFWKYDNVFEKNMDHFNSINYFVGGGRVYVTNEYYDGRIYAFDKNKNWAVNVMEGYKPMKQGYEIFERPRGSTTRSFGRMGHSISFGENWNGSMKSFTVYIDVRSAGLFLLNNKYLVNFIVTGTRSGKYEFGVDLLNPDGSHIGYTKLEEKDIYSMMDKVYCMDNEGNFIIGEGKGTIRKFRLVIN